MKLLFISLVILGVGLSGCVTPGTSTITPEQLIVAGNAFDAMEATATNYLKLPLCPKATVCRTAAISKSLVSAVRAARSARSQLESYVNANPGQPLPVNLYQTVSTAITTLQSLMSTNNIN